jgi:hypothetical protein
MTAEKISIHNFGPDNRSRQIGNSLYRICNTEPEKGRGKWYIHEQYNDSNEFSGKNSGCSSDLGAVIEELNSFTHEKEIIWRDKP